MRCSNALVELLLVRYSKYLPEAILYKIYMVYIDVITMLIIGVLSFNITPISTFRGAIVSEIQKWLPEGICCYITRFTLYTEILSQR